MLVKINFKKINYDSLFSFVLHKGKWNGVFKIVNFKKTIDQSFKLHSRHHGLLLMTGTAVSNVKYSISQISPLCTIISIRSDSYIVFTVNKIIILLLSCHDYIKLLINVKIYFRKLD